MGPNIIANTGTGIEKFIGKNFSLWKFKIMSVLEAKDLWEVVSEDRSAASLTGKGEEKRDGKDVKMDINEKEFMKKNNMALAMIVLSLGDQQINQIKHIRSAREAWLMLEEIYESSSLSNQMMLEQEFMALSMNEDEEMLAYTTRVRDKVDEMKACGMRVTDKQAALRLLGTVSARFKPAASAIAVSCRHDVQWNDVANTLLHEEKRLNVTEPMSKEYSGENLFLSRKSNRRFNGKERSRKDDTCRRCQKRGHWARDCKVPLNEAHIAETDDEEEEYLFVHEVENETVEWILDSGASSHLCANKDAFYSYVPLTNSIQITIGDGSKIKAIGRGTIEIHLKEKNEQIRLVLKDVLHVPAVKENLMSVKKLMDDYSIVFEKGYCKILDKNKLIFKSKNTTQNLFKVTGQRANKEVSYYSQKDELQILTMHRAMGHMSAKSMLAYIKAKQPNTHVNLANVELITEQCEVCMKGKMQRGRFNKNLGIHSKESLELIHTDVWGPSQEASLGGSRYFVTLIDDFSKHVTVKLMKSKNEVIEHIKDYVKLMETQLGKRVKRIRSDNGGEYHSKELQQWLRKRGVKQEFSVPYYPEQNGVAERFNRTLVEMTRCLLYDSGLEKKFWGEAVSHASFLLNTFLVRGGTTANEVLGLWTQRKLVELERFGTTAWAHVPSEKRGKLDPKARKHIFLGYACNSSKLRLIDCETGKLNLARTAKFTLEKNVTSSTDTLQEEECYQETDKIPKEIFDKKPENGSPVEETLSGLEQAFRKWIGTVSTVIKGTGNENETVTRKSTRISKAPERYIANLAVHKSSKAFEEITEGQRHMLETEPMNFDEATKSKNGGKWNEAMRSEINSLMSNGCWELTTLPKGKHLIKSKWVFKLKQNENGEIDKFKARLVACGYSQKFGCDYSESYAPVPSIGIVRYWLAFGNAENYVIHHMDVATAFLNGEIEEEIYIAQPPGFIDPENPDKVCRLRKALYGLKQAPKAWNRKLIETLEKLDFKQGQVEPCVFSQDTVDGVNIIIAYVDDLLLLFKKEEALNMFKERIMNTFKVNDLGKVKWYLGMKIDFAKGTLKVSQESFTKQLLEACEMQHCKEMSTPMEENFEKLLCEDKHLGNEMKLPYRSIIGSLIYLSNTTRPDIATAISILSSVTENPNGTAWSGVRRVLRYLKGTLTDGILYDKNMPQSLECFCDANWGSPPDRKSRSGFVFLASGGAVLWSSRKQRSVALSTAESEYVSLSEAAKDGVFLTTHIGEVVGKKEMLIMNCDNQSALLLAKNDTTAKRTKHVDIRYHFVREKVHEGKIELKYLKSENMIADIFTKPLGATKFKRFCRSLGMKPHVEEECENGQPCGLYCGSVAENCGSDCGLGHKYK